MVLLAALLLLLLAALAWGLARLGFAPVKGYVDGLAPDGAVETYSPAFHERVRGNLRALAAGCAGVAGLLLAGGRLLARSLPRDGMQRGALWADLRRALVKLHKRTSRTHKLFVAGIIAVGAVLRLVQLQAPIIYDEAFTYVYYAVRPLAVIVSDYSYPNNQVLHTILVKLSTAVFGVHLWSLRLPALLAGILAMPLAYLFVRAHFNRYIALLMLAFVASSGALIEYSALGRGYSIVWCMLLLGWLAGRHFAKTNALGSALAVAVVNALGMWTVTTMLYAAVACYLWLLLHLMVSYDTTLAKRLKRLALSFGVFVVLTAALYMPVIVVHGLGQLFHHPTMGDNSWEVFSATHQDRAFDLYAYFNDTAATWISLLGMAGMVYAAYISSKFRLLLVAMVAGAVPIVIAQRLVAPPRVWTYTLFVLHLSSAIALFYLLKLVQETLVPSLSKRLRTSVTALVVLAGLSYTGMRGIHDRIERFPEAALATEHFRGALGPADRVMVEFPWEAPVEFHFMDRGIPIDALYRTPASGAAVYVLVSPAREQTFDGVLLHHRFRTDQLREPTKVKDWKRLEIWRATVR
ncbi:MAG: glycosyltransferase family 39 protein [Flavobacteriales bacterium]|nr:hypothetical protein [Flavobacteriales bacterium]MCC6577570.1 glycosyltransferase family 39 protein [Flavobacteriales bacterium]NUQ14650.1 glycosyltransferase family 39 protein [Flavobacteriales bacterium]